VLLGTVLRTTLGVDTLSKLLGAVLRTTLRALLGKELGVMLELGKLLGATTLGPTLGASLGMLLRDELGWLLEDTIGAPDGDSLVSLLGTALGMLDGAILD
jgi:hypothetical protein